jgi:oligopeptide transport system permease protein
MLQFLLRKFLWVITGLVGVTLIMFLLMHAIPGNPWSNYSESPRMVVGLGIDKPLQRELYRRFGLDLPLWRQYTRYIIGDFEKDGSFICGAVCGNLGPSTRQRGRSVQEVLFEPPEGKSAWHSRFGYSIRLVLFSSLIAIGVGIPLGVLSVKKPKAWISRFISVGLAGLVAVPNFVFGLLAIIVLASWLKLIKVIPDWENPSDWIVPAVVLAIMPMASLARVTNASLMNILNEDFVRTARGKGLTETQVMLNHVMRNALVPIITFMGPVLMEMFTGLFIVEYLYSFPGFGQEYWAAVISLDYPMIMGLTLIYAVGMMIVSILIEFLCVYLDPRLHLIEPQGAA